MLGLITIGQSPRPDLAAEFETKLGAERVRLVGALDTCSEAELAHLTDGPHKYPLITRLRTGATLEVELEKLVPFVKERAEQLAREGAVAAILLCTGDFPALETRLPLLLSSPVVRSIVVRTAAKTNVDPGEIPGRAAPRRDRRPIGVVAPLAAQMPNTRAKWKQDGFDAVVTTASPYVPAEAARVADVFQHEDVSLIVLDCLGYDRAFLDAFKKQLRRIAPRHEGTPVILPQRALAEEASRLFFPA